MGMNEDLAGLSARLASLTKKQENIKALLAVEEHKLVELTASLKEDGVDVTGLDMTQLDALAASLLTTLQESKAELDDKLTSTETLYAKLDTLQ